MIARICNNPECLKVIMTAYHEEEIKMPANWPIDSIKVTGTMLVGDYQGGFVIQDAEYCNVKCLAEDIKIKSEQRSCSSSSTS